MGLAIQLNSFAAQVLAAVTGGVGVLPPSPLLTLHRWRLQSHIHGTCKWRYRHTPTPLEECSLYVELYLLLCAYIIVNMLSGLLYQYTAHGH